MKRDLDGGIGEELHGPDDEEEDAHDVLVALEEGGRGKLDLRLEFVRDDGGGEAELQEDERKGYESEDDEKENVVVVVEEVVGHLGGVAEPEGLSDGQVAAQRRLRGGDRLVRHHLRRRRRKGTTGQECREVPRYL